MLFNSYLFILGFLPFVWAIFHSLKAWSIKRDSLLGQNLAKYFLILASLFFYAYWKLIYLPILLGSILINYSFARAILNTPKNSLAYQNLPTSQKNTGLFTNSIKFNGGGARHKDRAQSFYSQHLNPYFFCKTPAKLFLFLGISFNLCLLIIFKYTDFFLENFNLFAQIFNPTLQLDPIHIVLPLALSFITFQQIGFLVDCYKSVQSSSDSQKSDPVVINFIDYCLFISFFPQLIAGPIVHHREILPQLRHLFLHTHSLDSNSNKAIESANTRMHHQILNWENIAKGLFIFFIGLFKKAFIAEGFGKWANAGFNAVENGQILNLAESWATSLCYTFQLYFDFSGYCDMAIGLGLLFGITLPLNFNSPYKALNITDFWRGWHITLGQFFKRYLYIPLGGNRNEKYKKFRFYNALNKTLTLRNLFIVAFLSGVWHGAGFGFIIWGALHGLAMMLHRIYKWGVQNLEHTISKTNHVFETQISSGSINTPLSPLSSPISLFLHFRETTPYKVLCWILTFNFVSLAWIFFRAQNLEGAFNLLSGMFSTHLVFPLPFESYLGFLHPYIEFGKWADIMTDSSSKVYGWIGTAFIICLYARNSVQWMHSLKPNWLFLLFLIGLSLISFDSLNQIQEFLYFNF